MIEEIVDRVRCVPDLRRTAGTAPTSYLLYANRGEPHSSIVMFLFGDGRRPYAVVKMSRDIAILRREGAALEQLVARAPGRVPRPYLNGQIRGMGFLAMEAVPGKALTPTNFATRVAESVRTLLELHLSGADGVLTTTGLRTELVEPLARFAREWTAGRPELATLCADVRRRLDAMAGVPLPDVPQHGDLCVDNILLKPDDTLVIVDWEVFGTAGLPAYDLVTLFTTVEGVDPFHDRALQRHLADSLRRYAREMGIDARWLAILVPVAMMRFALFCAAEGRPEAGQMILSRLEALARMGDRFAAVLGV